jgi:hypothetical protein
MKKLGLQLKEHLRRSKIRLALPLIPFVYEVGLDDLTNSRTVDERIARLAGIKEELEGAIEAVGLLQKDAEIQKTQVNELQETISNLSQDKQTAEALLAVPHESVMRLIGEASTRARYRGWIEGSVIGLVTGFLSGLVVWWLTSGQPLATP